jgi:hypothetical protein
LYNAEKSDIIVTVHSHDASRAAASTHPCGP